MADEPAEEAEDTSALVSDESDDEIPETPTPAEPAIITEDIIEKKRQKTRRSASAIKFAPGGDIELNKENLKKMVRPQLIALSSDLEIECEFTDPKDRIIEKILSSQ